MEPPTEITEGNWTRTRWAAVVDAAFRAFVGCLGLFTACNWLGELIRPGFGVNEWWIDGRYLPGVGREVLLVLGSVLWIAAAVRPLMGRPRRVLTWIVCALFVGLAVVDGVVVVRLDEVGRIRAGTPWPLSWLVALVLGATGAWVCGLAPRVAAVGAAPRLRALVSVVVGAAFILAIPLFQIAFFGRTDYRRPADAIVVFGCLAYANGSPSTSLLDRVTTACELYEAGLAPRIVFSGGPTAGPLDETDVMRRLALERGVPPEAILLDRRGLDTWRTAENTAAMFRALGVRRVLAVSHFYHLPRVRLAYRRAGVRAYTVPAVESRWVPKTPWSVAREIPALWAYWLRPVADLRTARAEG